MKLWWFLILAGWLGACIVLGLVGVSPEPGHAPVHAPAGEARAKLRPDPRKGRNLNVLVITLDTTRRDRLGCYGYSPARTPTLDALAAEGIRFDHATAVAPVTLPSHTTIFTGLYPSRHGVHANGGAALSPESETLAEILSRYGYETAAFVSAFVLHRQYGLDQGFGTYDDEVVRSENDFSLLVSERRAEDTTDSALAWLATRDHGRNYFLWVHYYDPHIMYAPPTPFRETFAGNPYDGEIAYMDAEIGRLLQGIRDHGAWERTLVVVTADHGESLGEHGEATHGMLIFDSSMRIPFILDHPEGRGDRGGDSRWRQRVIEEDVELADITPTILEVVGADTPDSLDGQSLVPLIAGDERRRPTGAYGESYEAWMDYGWARLHSWREGRWKYIHGAREELYDVNADPGELRNLASAHPEEARRLRSDLERSLERAARTALRPSATALDAETEAKLRSLGYIASSGPVATDTAAVNLADDLARRDPSTMMPVYNADLQPALNAINAGDLRKAREYLLRVLAVDPANPMVLLHLARCEVALDDGGTGRNRARVLLEKLVRDHPNLDQAMGSLAELHRAQGDLASATVLLRRLLSLRPENARAHGMLASCLLEQRDVDGAIAEGRLAVSQDPGHAPTLFNLGLAYEMKGIPDLAADAYRSALAADPRYASAMVNLGNLYAQNAPRGRAVSLYLRALPLLPEAQRAGVLANLGNVYSQNGENEAALHAYREALALDARNAQLHYLVGCSLSTLGREPEARAEWLRALELDPGHPEARHRLEDRATATVTSGR